MLDLIFAILPKVAFFEDLGFDYVQHLDRGNELRLYLLEYSQTYFILKKPMLD